MKLHGNFEHFGMKFAKRLLTHIAENQQIVKLERHETLLIRFTIFDS